MKLSTAASLPFKLLAKDRLSILIYHRVLSENDTLWPNICENEFRAHMTLIKRYFNPIGLPEAIEALRNNALPPRAVAITFDDGYADNATNATPILAELDMTATFFISTDFLNGGAMWLDKIIEAIRCYPEDEIDLSVIGGGREKTGSLEEKRQLIYKITPAFRHMELNERNEKTAHITELSPTADTSQLMLSSRQLIDMQNAGMTIGAHTQGHPNLCHTSAQVAGQQIEGSKKILEDTLKKPVSLFAYPFGKENKDFSIEHAKIAQELGFKAAVTTDYGVSCKETDLFRLPRFTPWDKSPAKFLLRLATNHTSQPAISKRN